MENNSKKGQLGQTITWFVTVIIIIFAAILFITASFWLAGKKTINSDKNQINLDNSGYLTSIQDLQSILDYKLSDKTVKDLIFEWVIEKDNSLSNENKRKLKDSIYGILKKYEECRIFESYYGDEIKTYEDFINNEKKIIVVSNIDTNQESLFGRLQRVPETILIINNETIRNKLYIGKC